MTKTRTYLASARRTRSDRSRTFDAHKSLSVLRTTGFAAILAAIGLTNFAGPDLRSLLSFFSGPAYSGPPPRNCAEARARGIAPMSRWHPAYSAHLDRDGDGIACEPYFGR